MTQQEFDNIVKCAELGAENEFDLFEEVNIALRRLTILDQYGGDKE